LTHTRQPHAAFVLQAFGEEGERRIIAWKAGHGPSPEDIEMMERELPYEECIADLKRRKEAIEKQEAYSQKASVDVDPEKTKVKVSGKQAKLIQDAAANLAAAPVAKASYGMVSSSFRADKRSVDEALNDAAAKKRRLSSEGQ
jgi:hypothetical protein